MTISRGYQRALFDGDISTAAVELAAAQPGKIIRVRGVVVGSDADQKVELLTNATAILPLRVSLTGPAVVLPITGGGVAEAWALCAKDEPLKIIGGSTTDAYGVVYWDTIDA